MDREIQHAVSDTQRGQGSHVSDQPARFGYSEDRIENAGQHRADRVVQWCGVPQDTARLCDHGAHSAANTRVGQQAEAARQPRVLIACFVSLSTR